MALGINWDDEDALYNPPKVEIVDMNETWIEEKNFRLGKLKFFVNGKIFMVIEKLKGHIPKLNHE